MRRLLSFSCEGAQLGASLDEAAGSTALLIVTGGTQTRIGSHRMFERLALALAQAGYPCLRFDRRGVGDSEGADPDFRGNGSDIAAAADALREACPQVGTLIGFGLCDGATSLALFGARARLAGAILVNPWFVEAEAGQPPAAAIRRHYWKRLFSIAGWKKVLSGSISYGKLFKGLAKISKAAPPNALAGEVAGALAAGAMPIELILARDDATAVAAADVWSSSGFAAQIKRLRTTVTMIDTDSHTFARPGDMNDLRDACLEALGRLGSSRSA